jgi:fluoroacetyl-CoA thioesterase
MQVLQPGLSASVTTTVTEADTAEAVGSGTVPALATPKVLALMESAAVRAVAKSLAPGTTTVGVSVHLTHSRPAAVGTVIITTANLVAVRGRCLEFSLLVIDEFAGTELAVATHSRSVVDIQVFMRRLGVPTEEGQ